MVSCVRRTSRYIHPVVRRIFYSCCDPIAQTRFCNLMTHHIVHLDSNTRSKLAEIGDCIILRVLPNYR